MMRLITAFGVQDLEAFKTSCRMEDGAWDYDKINVAMANCGNAQLIGFLRILDSLSRPEVSLRLVLLAPV